MRSLLGRCLALVACFLLLVRLLAWAQPITGPDRKYAPVVTAAVVQPSPNSSPVTAGNVVQLAANQYGHLMTQVIGGVTATLTAGNIGVVSNTGGGSLNVTTTSNVTLQSGTGAANVTLPAASPVPVQGMLPLASPIGTLTSLPVVISSGLTTGYTTYCAPEFGGGSSESTIKSGQGLLLGGHASTNSTADTYLLLWDASNPTPGTTAPLATLLIPASPSGTVRAMSDFYLPPPGLGFSTALTATTATASNGSTAPSGNVTLNLFIK